MSNKNKLSLSTDINVITAEINAYQRVAGEAIFEIGRRLAKVKNEKMAEQHGGWAEWLRTVGMNRQVSHQMIKVYEELGESNVRTSLQLGMQALYEIATLPPEQREIPHVTSTGETKTPDEMTVRELREVKRELKKTQEERDAERKEREQAEISRNRAEAQAKVSQQSEDAIRKQLEEFEVTSKTVEVEKIVEIDKTDYNSINRLNSQLEKLNRELDLANRNISTREKEIEIYKSDAEAYEKMQKDIKSLTQTKDSISRQIESATSISGLVVEIEHVLQNKLAPVKYSKAISEQKDNPVVIDNVSEIVKRVKDWCYEMEKLVGDNAYNGMVIVDGEVVESELL